MLKQRMPQSKGESHLTTPTPMISPIQSPKLTSIQSLAWSKEVEEEEEKREKESKEKPKEQREEKRPKKSKKGKKKQASNNDPGVVLMAPNTMNFDEEPMTRTDKLEEILHGRYLKFVYTNLNFLEPDFAMLSI